MTLQKPLEALLRPPIEWMTSVVAVTAILVVLDCPMLFLLTERSSKIFAAVLSFFALYRFKQGYRVYQYQRRLKQMPTYAVTSKALLVSQKRLFLGKGFLWTPQHTQRLRDLDLSYNLHYKYPSRLKTWARLKELSWENKLILNKVAELFKINHIANPFRPYPPIGGEPSIHGVSETESDVSTSLTDREGHTIVIGAPGVGKTRCAETLVAQDIRRGDVFIFLDPKGDADLLERILIEAKLAGREKDVLVLHLGFPQFSCRYNPIGYFTKITQVATRITNAMPGTGEAASFKDFAWKYVTLVAETLVALGQKPSYKVINFYITKLDLLFMRYAEHYFPLKDEKFEEWIATFIQENTKISQKEEDNIRHPTRSQSIMAYTKVYIEKRNKESLHKLENNLIIDLFSACRLDKTYYDKITASVGPLLKKLTTDDVADLLSPDYNDLNDERPIFDWLQVIRHKKIVYIGMDAMTDTVVSSAVGNAILTDLVSVAGHLYKFNLTHGFDGLNQSSFKLPRINIHLDEFNEIIGDEFIPILNKARGAGFNVTAYTQTWSDVEARLGSAAKAGQTAGNFNNFIMFRTKEMASVEMLLSQLPTIPILRVIPASSSADTPHGEEGVYYRSTNEDRFVHSEQRLIEQTDVLNLPKGQAFCLLEGGKLYKVRMPLHKKDDVEIPSSMSMLTSKMRDRQNLIKKSTGEKAI
jgi:conjugative coupling factor TraD (TOL family)